MRAQAQEAGIEIANGYRLLSRAYGVPDAEGQAPSEVRPALTGVEELFACLRAARGTVSGPCSDVVEHASLERDPAPLRVDHSRLFVGPFKLLAPPYGSMYLEHTGQVMGDSTLDVRSRYETEGLGVTLSEVPDHVAIELEFAHFLAAREVRAIQESDVEGAALCAGKRRDFLSVHLGAWIGEFAANVGRHAGTAFYGALASATEAFVLEDLARLRSAAPGPEEATEPVPTGAETRP